MQEKTLEEDFEDKFSGLWLDGMHDYEEDMSYGEKETKEKLLSFISYREEKAKLDLIKAQEAGEIPYYNMILENAYKGQKEETEPY